MDHGVEEHGVRVEVVPGVHKEPANDEDTESKAPQPRHGKRQSEILVDDSDPLPVIHSERISVVDWIASTRAHSFDMVEGEISIARPIHLEQRFKLR